jgi:[acyl-carrier-protein] S-malonyltransferase
MRTAAESGVTKFIEFGGGIGKGEGPEEKKPNLQSIINKNMRALEHEADYQPAINVLSLQALAE